MEGEAHKPLCLGWAVWSTKFKSMSRRHIYRTKRVAQQYCEPYLEDVPVAVYASSFTRTVEYPLVTS